MSAQEFTWLPSSAETFDEALNLVPPAVQLRDAFLFGEAMGYDDQGRATFLAHRYDRSTDTYHVGSRPVSAPEFRAMLGIGR